MSVTPSRFPSGTKDTRSGTKDTRGGTARCHIWLFWIAFLFTLINTGKEKIRRIRHRSCAIKFYLDYIFETTKARLGGDSVVHTRSGAHSALGRTGDRLVRCDSHFPVVCTTWRISLFWTENCTDPPPRRECWRFVPTTDPLLSKKDLKVGVLHRHPLLPWRTLDSS